MADSTPTPSPDQRRIAAENFERARQVLTSGNSDYAIQLLRTCCRIDPGNLHFRQTLRRAQKARFGDDLKGSKFAFLLTPKSKASVKAAKASRDYLKVLEAGEDVLTRNPWDLGTQMDMAEAFEALGLSDLAVFSLDQARQKYPKDPTLNRALARLFEKRGDFQKAIALWRLVQEADPRDLEAASKAKNLAASETIARGGYEEAISGSKESPVVGRMEAAATEKQDRLGREVGAIQKRIEAEPTEPALYVQLSNLYRRHNQLDRARATLQQGLGPTAQHFSLQLELLELDLIPLRANLDETEAKLKAAKARDEDEPDLDGPTVEELAEIRARLKKEIYARESEILRVKVDRFPAEVVHRIELGKRLMKLDKLDEAITELQQARRDEKLKGQAAMLLGVCFRKRNNWRLAQRNFEEALTALTAPQDEPARKEVLFQLATGSADAGDLAKAVELGNELANIDFGYKNISGLLDQWDEKAKSEA
ncbi:MAG: tetratricopeptide repeat protein [Fimbriiglobus sp.]|nr:tetratricopeptide repeat protein [Fimbriiglobus sp.]